MFILIQAAVTINIWDGCIFSPPFFCVRDAIKGECDANKMHFVHRFRCLLELVSEETANFFYQNIIFESIYL